jgi:nicotinamidase/pyrazinamidase
MEMKPGLIIVDLLRDTFEKHHRSNLVQSARIFIPRLNELIDRFHENSLPVIFACDSFLPDDLLFTGKMERHSLRGTPGASVISELNQRPDDYILPKRRFSAFFKTDLDQTLRTLGINTVLVTGIATHICVLTTALDAVSHDFRAVIVEDCCAAHRIEQHQAILNAYGNTPLSPLLQVMNSERCFKKLTHGQR